jgi:hypothetical protein
MDQIDIDKIKAAIEALVKEIFKTVFVEGGALSPKQGGQISANAERVLFPHGVELFDIEAKVGPTGAPLFDFHLKIAGPAGTAPGGPQLPGGQATGISNASSHASAR